MDPRCPKLVCRVRKKGDDVKAGVGGQRGTGLHARWVKEIAKKNAGASSVKDEDRASTKGTPSQAQQGQVAKGQGNKEEELPERPPLHRGGPAAANPKKSSSGSSVSYASTTSSLLTRHYPVRYFILKSLTPVSIFVFILL